MVSIGKSSVSKLPAVFFDGLYRVLACLPETAESKAGFPMFGSNMAAPLDPSQWQEIDLSWYRPPILDQGMTSACVGHGACSGMEMCWLQSGQSLQEFSPWFIYGLINGGRDQGAMISDALNALQSKGVCPKEDIPSGMMFQNQFPQQSFTDALQFKLLKAYHCPDFESICSAISLGFVAPIGLMVGANFAQLDSEGVAPLPAGGGGGHCVLGVGLKKSTNYGWIIKIQNSWGLRFGMSGYAYLRKEHLQHGLPPDAFAIQSISPSDNNVPIVTMHEADILIDSARNFGFDNDWIKNIQEKLGKEALAIVVEASRQGMNKTFIAETLANFDISALRTTVIAGGQIL